MAQAAAARRRRGVAPQCSRRSGCGVSEGPTDYSRSEDGLSGWRLSCTMRRTILRRAYQPAPVCGAAGDGRRLSGEMMMRKLVFVVGGGCGRTGSRRSRSRRRDRCPGARGRRRRLGRGSAARRRRYRLASRDPASRSSSVTTSTPASTRSSASTATTRSRSRPSPGSRRCKPAWGAIWSSAGSDSSHQTEIKKVRQAWSRKEADRMGPRAYLARHAHFPHQRHIKALGPNACATCHGDVSGCPRSSR